jgi:hypothetical protein
MVSPGLLAWQLNLLNYENAVMHSSAINTPTFQPRLTWEENIAKRDQLWARAQELRNRADLLKSRLRSDAPSELGDRIRRLTSEADQAEALASRFTLYILDVQQLMLSSKKSFARTRGFKPSTLDLFELDRVSPRAQERIFGASVIIPDSVRGAHDSQKIQSEVEHAGVDAAAKLLIRSLEANADPLYRNTLVLNLERDIVEQAAKLLPSSTPTGPLGRFDSSLWADGVSVGLAKAAAWMPEHSNRDPWDDAVTLAGDADKTPRGRGPAK